MEPKETKEEKTENVKEEQTVGPRIVNVSANRNFSFFVYQAKKFLKVAEEKPVVELHAIGSAISVAVQAAETLVKYKYCVYDTIKTDKVEVERENGNKLSRAKLFITLNKSKEFDEAWEDFEKKREEIEKERAEKDEHKDKQ